MLDVLKLDKVRTSLYRALTSPRGDALAIVRVQKDLARRLNVTLGMPLCSEEELEKRRAAEARFTALRNGIASGAAAPTTRAAAPVMIYFEKDRNTRELVRVKEALEARAITYTLLDVAGDETTLDFVQREAKCEADDLPIVFVAGAPIGGFKELIEWDVSGRLATAVFG